MDNNSLVNGLEDKMIDGQKELQDGLSARMDAAFSNIKGQVD